MIKQKEMTQKEMAKMGGKAGGPARARALTAERRSEIAKNASIARWKKEGKLKNKDILKTTHRGELTIGDISIPCAVLEGGERVLSERSVASALGSKGSGAYWEKKRIEGSAILPEYVSKNYLEPFIDKKVKGKLMNTISYVNTTGKRIEALPAELLPEICDIWLKARDKSAFKNIPKKDALSAKNAAKKAEILVRGLAHVGIIALVDEATGYQEIRDRKALQAILDKYLKKEFATWAKCFPDEFYQEMFRLKKWKWKGMSINRPSVVGTYTKEIVYKRLAPGILKELENRNPKNLKGYRTVRHHQWLTNDIGHPVLAQHLYAVIGLMRACDTWDIFKRMLQRAFPKKNDNLELPFVEETNEK